MQRQSGYSDGHGPFLFILLFYSFVLFSSRADKSRMNCWEMDELTVIDDLVSAGHDTLQETCAVLQLTWHILSKREKKKLCTLSNKFFWSVHFHHRCKYSMLPYTLSFSNHFYMSPIGQHAHRLTWGWWGSSCHWRWLFQWCSFCWWREWLTQFLLFQACWLQEEKDWKLRTTYLLTYQRTGRAVLY